MKRLIELVGARRATELFRRHARATLGVSALAITLLATVVSGREKASTEDAVEPSVRAAAQAATAATGNERGSDRATAAGLNPDLLDLDRLKRSRGEESKTDLFGADPVVAPQTGSGTLGPSGIHHQPVGPADQPLPFAYLGRMIDDGKVSVFLAQGEDSYSVQQGEVVQQYRVDKITEKDIRFTHVPTRTHKVLVVPPLN